MKPLKLLSFCLKFPNGKTLKITKHYYFIYFVRLVGLFIIHRKSILNILSYVITVPIFKFCFLWAGINYWVSRYIYVILTNLEFCMTQIPLTIQHDACRFMFQDLSGHVQHVIRHSWDEWSLWKEHDGNITPRHILVTMWSRKGSYRHVVRGQCQLLQWLQKRQISTQQDCSHVNCNLHQKELTVWQLRSYTQITEIIIHQRCSKCLHFIIDKDVCASDTIFKASTLLQKTKIRLRAMHSS